MERLGPTRKWTTEDQTGTQTGISGSSAGRFDNGFGQISENHRKLRKTYDEDGNESQQLIATD